MNKAILLGRLTADPELRYTTANIPVCRFSIAVDRPYAKQGEERQADFLELPHGEAPENLQAVISKKVCGFLLKAG